ncbi:MAG TPA: cell division protein ZapA [Alphaproteobacteria bacterium]
MPNVVITLQGRPYTIACDEGQERRVQQLALYVDQKLREIAKTGAAASESYQMVLASIILADELLSAKEQLDGAPAPETAQKVQRQQDVDVAAVQHLTNRLEALASKLQDAG